MAKAQASFVAKESRAVADAIMKAIRNPNGTPDPENWLRNVLEQFAKAIAEKAGKTDVE